MSAANEGPPQEFQFCGIKMHLFSPEGGVGGLCSILNSNGHYLAAHDDGYLVMDDEDPNHHDIPWYIYVYKQDDPALWDVAIYNWQNATWLSSHNGQVFANTATVRHPEHHHTEWVLRKVGDKFSLQVHSQEHTTHGYLTATGVFESEDNPPATNPHVTVSGSAEDPATLWTIQTCPEPPHHKK